MISKRELLFVLSLSLIPGIIKAVIISPVGKVQKIFSGKNMSGYVDDKGTGCMFRSNESQESYLCENPTTGQPPTITGTRNKTGDLAKTGDFDDAAQSYQNFKKACKCN